VSINLPRLQVNRPNTAHVHIGDLRLFYSYETCVAFKETGGSWVVSENIWSATTGRHIMTETGVNPAGRLPHQEFTEALSEACARHLAHPQEVKR